MAEFLFAHWAVVKTRFRDRMTPPQKPEDSEFFSSACRREEEDVKAATSPRKAFWSRLGYIPARDILRTSR